MFPINRQALGVVSIITTNCIPHIAFEMRIFVLLAFIAPALSQHGDPASHGFTINTPGQTSTATFGYTSTKVTSDAQQPAVAAGRQTQAYSPVVAQAEPVVIQSGRPIAFARDVPLVLSNTPDSTWSNGSPDSIRNIQSPATVVEVQAGSYQTYDAQRPSFNGRGCGQENTWYAGSSPVYNTIIPQQTPSPVSVVHGRRTYHSTYAAKRPSWSSGVRAAQNARNDKFSPNYNPTVRKQPPRFDYQVGQRESSPSHGYTVNAPGFTKHKTFAGPVIHGTNQAFLHASG